MKLQFLLKIIFNYIRKQNGVNGAKIYV